MAEINIGIIAEIVFLAGLAIFIGCLLIISLALLIRATYDIVKEIWKNGVF